MTELNIEQERLEFEAWHGGSKPMLFRVENNYAEHLTQLAWSAWLAAKSSLIERLQVAEDVAKSATMGSIKPSAANEFNLNQEKQEFEIWYANKNIIKKSPVSIFVKTKAGDYTHSFMRAGFERWLLSKKNSLPPTDINDTKRLDFMLANPSYNLVFFDLGQEWCVCSDYGGWSISSGKTQREAIDAAITIAENVLPP